MDIIKSINGEELTVRLSGRLDANTVSELDQSLTGLESVRSLVLDFEQLEYLSSAGLRQILKYKKRIDATCVVNCGKEVYDIMEMTGFTEIMSVSRQLRRISVDDCELIGEGFYGRIYRLDPETIVKVYKIQDALGMIKKEIGLSKKAFIMGIPTAIAYDIVRVGDLYGAVFELLNAEPVVNLINSDEALGTFAVKSAQILKEMHSKELPSGELPSRKKALIGILEELKSFFAPDVYDKLSALLASIEDRNTIIHADFHVKNIMSQGDELLLIDMETLSQGHPIFEFGAMYATYRCYACVDKHNTDKFLGMPLETTTKLFDRIFGYYYDDRSEKELEEMKYKLSVISYLQVLNLRSKYAELSYGTEKEEVEYCVKYLTECAGKLDTLRF